MFDVGFWELSLLGVLGLLILGPERLPVVARTLGGWVRRSRRYLRNFAEEITGDESISELRSEVQKMRSEIENVDSSRHDDDEPASDEFDEKTGERRRDRSPRTAYTFEVEDLEPAPNSETDHDASAHDAAPADEPVATELEPVDDEDDDLVYARARRGYLAESERSTAGAEAESTDRV